MHTNSTPNFNLPQYVGTDIINPLTDTNGAYSDIDTALKAIADNEATDASKITALETTVGDNTAGLVKKVADLEAQNGDAPLATTAQTLTGAVNELDSGVDTVTGVAATNASNITALQTSKADATATTNAINQLNSRIDGLAKISNGAHLFYANLLQMRNNFVSAYINLPMYDLDLSSATLTAVKVAGGASAIDITSLVTLDKSEHTIGVYGDPSDLSSYIGYLITIEITFGNAT